MPDLDAHPDPLVLSLAREGWAHLQRQRPVAAWASWRRALRVEPEHKAATDALHVLANADDLPQAAKVERRFLTPVDELRRTAWDLALRGRDLEDLALASEAFAQLADSDPSDARARYNQGLCLAWLGRNAESVAALDQAVQVLAIAELETAVEAWALAEILRQGGGAEPLADDLNHVVLLSWTPGSTDPAGFLDGRPDIRELPNPINPLTSEPRLSEARVYEWLEAGPESAERRLLATAIRLPRSLRLSGPDAVLLLEAQSEAVRAAGPRVASSRFESTPLPLALLDAAVWAIRRPSEVEADEEARDRLNRSRVETYYENAWVTQPRIGLDGRSPVEAAQLARQGDRVALAKLSSIVLVREQLGSRRATARLYQGYPFDRLRHRLGLPPTDPDAVDPTDPSCMSAFALDQLDPLGLAEVPLVEAYQSALALGDDRRTARFAEVLANRPPKAISLDIEPMVATLVRVALADDDLDLALARIDRAIAVDADLNEGRGRRTYQTWKAQAQARSGQPDGAALIYRGILDEAPEPTIALEAAEFLLDNGHDHQAQELARVARDLAEKSGDDVIGARAEALL